MSILRASQGRVTPLGGRPAAWLAGPALAALLAGGRPAAAQTVINVPADAAAVTVTSYTEGAAMVTDRRPVTLPQGRVTLRVLGLAGNPLPGSLQVGAEPDPASVSLVRYSMQSGVSAALALARMFVGRDVVWAQYDRDGKEAGRVTARLLEINGDGTPSVLRVGQETLLNPPGRLILPGVQELPPAGAYAEMELNVAAAGQRTLELDYLTNGWSWEPASSLAIAADGKGASLAMTARVTAPGGALPRVALKLAAGKPGPDAAPPIDVPGPLTLPADGTPVWCSLGQVNGIGVQEALVLKMDAVTTAGSNSIWETLRLAVPPADVPRLVPGPLRIYRQPGSPLLPDAELTLAAPPATGVFELPIRRPAELGAAARVLSNRLLNPVTHEYTCEVHFTNRREKPVVVTVIASSRSAFKITEHSHEVQKQEDGSVVFTVPVPAGEETKLTYTVEVKTGPTPADVGD